jgi:Bacteriophage Lambda NinG protein
MKAVLFKCDKRCVGPGVTLTDKSHSYILDTSHIFAKSVYPHIQFDLDNVILQCRHCHKWWHANIQEAKEWIEKYLGAEQYRILTQKAMSQAKEPSLDTIERYLKQAIKQYS